MRVAHSYSSQDSSVLRLVKRHIDAFNNRDLDRLCADFAQDIVFATGQDVVRGTHNVRAFLEDALRGAVDLQLELGRTVVEEDAAACELTESLTVDGNIHQESIAVFYTASNGALTTVKVYREGSAEISHR